MNECELKEEIKNLSTKYKSTKQEDLIEYLNYILEDKYDTKYCNLRLYNSVDKTKKIYLDFIKKYNLDDLLDNVIFNNKNYRFKESGIYDIDSNKKAVININNNTKDLFDLVRYSIILDQMNKGNDEVVSYIKAMLVEKKLLDYLIEIGYSNIECEKIKKYNFMEILYISNIVNCGLEEIKMYNQTFTISDNIFNKTKNNVKKCIENDEIIKYNFLNSKKYIYGIMYSTYLHQKLNDEQFYEFLNTNMKFSEFVSKYKEDSSDIYKSYDREYRI